MTVSTAATFTPVQFHTLVRHQLHCSSGQRVAPDQLIIQQSSTAQRQVQPIALHVMPQDSAPPPLALQTPNTPTTATGQSQHTEFLSVPSYASQPTSESAVVSTPTAPPAVLPDLPPLHLCPVLESVSQYSPLSSPPPLTMALPRLVQPQRSCVSAPSDYAGLFHQVRHASLEMNLQATMPEDRENGESAQMTA
ncbi:polyhomeotic-like protein 3 [Carassius carassius]|uniref:polyhomeotic-like protein 3 n=1 Tax=Carassius carassius TaxID=217509 RepID=UPI002868E44E|nr:polyhomeotic-like protein 3 [Carassius carassius]